MSDLNPPAVSIVISNTPYLSDQHLLWQVDALNRQTSKDFQVFYLNQSPDPTALKHILKQAYFPVQIIQLPFPWLAGTCCWDMVSVMGRLCEQPVHGKYLTYLHKECLPAPDFTARLLEGITAAEKEHGPDNIYRLNQLRCHSEVSQLEHLYPLDLSTEGIYWIKRTPFAPHYLYRESPWEEDSFALPLELIRKTNIFGAVDIPLFFQDLFDIFYQIEHLPGFEHINQIHLGYPVIFHLNHARAFKEYRHEFLTKVLAHPHIFGHLALFELASEPFDYHEGFAEGERILSSQLNRFVHYMRYSEKGTVTLWKQALFKEYLAQQNS